MRITAHVLLVACVAVTGLSSAAFCADHEVLMTGDYFGAMFFDPPSITIHPGDRVRWVNDAALIHTATAGTDCLPNGQWTTGSIDPGGASAYVTFNAPGSFDYFCRFHCEMGMVGLVRVEQPPVKVQPSTWGSIKALYITASPRP